MFEFDLVPTKFFVGDLSEDKDNEKKLGITIGGRLKLTKKQLKNWDNYHERD